ncbi:C4-type zinc ribbon domain-containing protein [Georgenia halophila]|uniref:C4-type zinc ribbon domain-containing protein n=1 Tax=Georgenia halophila TaxID=620889 RepID=A0ABP8LR01_9MICO
MTTAPKDAQRKLLDLQALDTRLAKLAHQRRTLPVLAALQELEGRGEDVHRAQVEARTVAADTRRELARSEADVEQVRSRAARHQATLDAGQGVSRELLALQNELAQLGERQSVLEEIELEIMERLETAEKQVAELEAQEKAIAGDREQHIADRDAAFAEIDAEAEKLNAQRAELAGEVDAELLDLYEYARSRTGGLGVVALHGHRTEGVSIDFSLSELSAIDTAAEDEVLVSEEHGYVLVRLDDGETSGRA